MTAKKVKKSVKKAEPVDTSKKIDELLTKAKCAVSGAEERPMGMKVRCPAWMEDYAARHPNVDFSRCPLDFWRGANNFLFKSFYRAYEERDGDLLKNPAIAEALCVIINEPRALARKFFYRYTESPQLYGGDYDGDLKRITDDWRYYCGYPDPFTGYADWFNLVFQDTGQASSAERRKGVGRIVFRLVVIGGICRRRKVRKDGKRQERRMAFALASGNDGLAHSS